MPKRAAIHKRRRKRARSLVHNQDSRFYWTRRWRRLRAAFIAANPICSDPEKRHTQIVRPAIDVDHIVPRKKRPDLAFHIGNLQGLCKSCHYWKTKRGE